MSLTRRRSGFTLVELLVVAGALAITGTQLLGAIQEAREAARRSQCKNNLKLLGLSLHNYHDVYQGLPPGWVGADSKPAQHNVFGLNGWGWNARVLPFMDQAPLFNQIDFSSSVADPKQAKHIGQTFPSLRCPSDPFVKKTWSLKDDKGESVAEVGTSNYVASFGTGDLSKCEKLKPGEKCEGDGLFDHNDSLRFNDIRDGLSNTVAIGERVINDKADRLATWTGVFPKAKSPFIRILGTSEQELNAREPNASGYGSAHKGGVHFLLMDGSVRFVKTDLDLKVLQGITTRAGLEEIPDF